jgi:hypothetical protein
MQQPRPADDGLHLDLDWDDVGFAMQAVAQPAIEVTRNQPSGGGGLWVLAAAGDTVLLVAQSRPFDPGAYDGPIIELGALALGLGADRLAVAVTGRAWSIDDPIPPVSGAGDMRQRVLMVSAVDGHRQHPPVTTTPLLPFEIRGRRVHWSTPPDLSDEPAVGWIPSSLAAAVAARHGFLDGPDRLHQTRTQLSRCRHLGHDVTLLPDGVARLAPAYTNHADR